MSHPDHTYLPTLRYQRFVDAYWVSESITEKKSRILPDGCSDIILYTTDEHSDISFVGPMTTAECVDIPPGACFVGIRFKPGTVLKHNRVFPAAMRDKTLSLPAEYTGILSSLQSQNRGGSLNLLDTLEHWISDLVRNDELIRDPEVDCLLDALQYNPTASLQSLYQTLNVSPRTIERRFLKMVGMTPKFFVRVQRHQQAARALSNVGDLFSMSALAQNLHYADQAHFIRDFTSLAGITPGEYQIEQQN